MCAMLSEHLGQLLNASSAFKGSSEQVDVHDECTRCVCWSKEQ